MVWTLARLGCTTVRWTLEPRGRGDTHLPLPTVRTVISIVPQSPDMFEGTLRENIDPVGEYPDADIWAALEHVRISLVRMGDFV